jgi:hypothetical protein
VNRQVVILGIVDGGQDSFQMPVIDTDNPYFIKKTDRSDISFLHFLINIPLNYDLPEGPRGTEYSRRKRKPQRSKQLIWFESKKEIRKLPYCCINSKIRVKYKSKKYSIFKKKPGYQHGHA